MHNTDDLLGQGAEKLYGLGRAKADAEVKAFMSTRTF